jgi:hypothetical protein
MMMFGQGARIDLVAPYRSFPPATPTGPSVVFLSGCYGKANEKTPTIRATEVESLGPFHVTPSKDPALT